MRILVIGDAPDTGDVSKQGLEAHGYTLDMATPADAARTLGAEGRHMLVLLDVSPAMGDGLAVLQAIRRTGSRVPVLVLTHRDRVEQRVAGLQLGADDYLVKPFTDAELISRMQALLQRSQRAAEVLRLADLELDLGNRSCTRAEKRIDLTTQELALLTALMRSQGRALSREELAAQVWDAKPVSDTNVIEVAVRRLRSRIDDGFPLKLLHTVRGQGYVLEDRS